MNLNTICNDCTKLNNGCGGTTNKVYTGCVYRNTKEKGQEQMKRKYNAEQRNYTMAKAMVDTLKEQAHEIERKYIAKNSIVNPGGEIPEYVWMIDDKAVFDKANADTAPAIDELGLYDAEQLLRETEDALINYALSIVPAKIRETLRRPCFGLDGDYVHIDTRAKVIGTAMQLDVSTV